MSGPSSRDLADACKGVLSQEDCQDLAELWFDDALGYAFTLLLETGVDDPEGFLKEKGILE